MTTVVQETKGKERTILSETNIWVRRKSFLVMLFAFLYFVSGGVLKSKTEAQAVAEPVQLPQWFRQWLDSQEAEMGEMSLKCEKVQGSEWNIRCRDSQAENQNPEWLNIHISSESPPKEGGDGESGLCCTACTKPILPTPTPTPTPTPNCTYYSETQSTAFEMELKKTIEFKLRQLLQQEISKQTSEACIKAASSTIRHRFLKYFELADIKTDATYTAEFKIESTESSTLHATTNIYTTDFPGESRGVSK